MGPFGVATLLSLVFRGFGLRERIDALLLPHEGKQLSPDAVAELELEASALFRDIITGLGLLPEHWTLRIHMDELLGPVPRLHGPKGEMLGLSVFERGLLDGTIELPEP